MALIFVSQTELIPESQADQIRTTQTQTQTSVDWTLVRAAVAISATRPTDAHGGQGIAVPAGSQANVTTGPNAPSGATSVDIQAKQHSAGISTAGQGAHAVSTAPFLSTAVMISPVLGLTTAHSLHQTLDAHVIDDMVVRPESRKLKVRFKAIHPEYKGNNFNGVDLAVFMLETPMKLEQPFTPVALDLEVLKDEVLQRIGFGERDKQNRRTWILENYKRRTTGKHYLTSEDKFGYPGDSGGPVYRTRGNGPELVGIHVGRMVDDNGKALDESNTLVLTPAILKWIEETTASWTGSPKQGAVNSASSGKETAPAPSAQSVSP